jgi:tetratricopeptide (TPR) repeat protein
MEEMQEYLEALFRRITEAYDTLLIEKTRKEYDLSLAMGGSKGKKKQAAEPHLNPEQQAGQLYERAKEAFKRGDLGEVVYCMEWVLRLGSEKAAYHALLGQALMAMPGKLKEAEQALQKAIQLDPSNCGYYISLGQVYKKGGMKNRALDQFQTALTWDPQNKQAQDEIRKL